VQSGQNTNRGARLCGIAFDEIGFAARRAQKPGTIARAVMLADTVV
jgi:hypothetical protein